MPKKGIVWQKHVCLGLDFIGWSLAYLVLLGFSILCWCSFESTGVEGLEILLGMGGIIGGVLLFIGFLMFYGAYDDYADEVEFLRVSLDVPHIWLYEDGDLCGLAWGHLCGLASEVLRIERFAKDDFPELKKAKLAMKKAYHIFLACGLIKDDGYRQYFEAAIAASAS